MIDFLSTASPATAATVPPPLEDGVLLDAYSDAVSRAVQAASSAVAHIDVRARRSRADGEGAAGSGSGFFLSPDGYALTNSHVVQGAAEMQVQLADG
ncbi:MAG TPA: hypothetical protein VFB27_12950, partial [Opitutaceae bacterium]|nr:hypothetical protein [Opitutaceae bacterium]